MASTTSRRGNPIPKNEALRLTFTLSTTTVFRNSRRPWGQTIEPTSKPLENTDFTLAHSMNLRRRSEAWMRAAWLPHQSCIRGSVSSSHAFSEIPPITTPFSGRSKPGKAHLAKPRQAPFERQDASCQRAEVGIGQRAETPSAISS